MKVLNLIGDVLILHIDQCRSNARRARMYMLAYKALEDCYNIDKDEEDSKPVLPSNAKYNHTLIKKCVSLFKRRRTHCNVIDFYSKYLSGANLKNLISKMCKPEVQTE